MAKKKPSEKIELLLPVVDAKDEMNLAEFPIALLSDRQDNERTSLVFQDTLIDRSSQKVVVRKLTITAPSEYGLPRAIDEDVIVALIQLTKLKNGFTSRKVSFTRNELIDLLGWAYNGKSYERLTASLYRWTAATLAYENAWWVKAEKRWTSKIFHIIEECEINDSRSSRGEQRLLTSEIQWNETVFNSFASGNLRNLDYRLYLGLEYATSKRMFRYLDKRFYYGAEQILDLHDFAFAHIGLSRTYAKNVAKIKEKLREALKELTEAGFLEPMPEDERYIKHGQTWKVVFKRKLAPLVIEQPEPPNSPLVTELTARGVTTLTARELVAIFTEEQINEKLAVFDWLVEKADKKVQKSPAGYLVKSIRDDYKAPKNYRSKTQQAQEQEEQRQKKAEECRAKAIELRRDAATKEAIDAYLTGLTAKERARVEREAIEASELDPRLFRASIIRMHVAELLGLQEAEA